MKGNQKKPRWMSYFSGAKIFLIFSITFSLILAALAPTINSNFIKNNDETYQEDNNKEHEGEYKKTSYEDDTYAYASFNWEPKYPDPGETITFTSSSWASNGYIVSEKWHFEDGYTASGKVVTFTYNFKGTFTVTLQVRAHGSGGSDYDTQTHHVEVGADPFPRISITPETATPGEEVVLDASQSSDPDGQIISYNWSYYDFENPKNVTYLGSDKVIYHKWEKQGIYNVVLNVLDDKGNNNTFEKTIAVSILKISDFDSFSRGLKFEISNQGNISADNVKWTVEIFRFSRLGIRSRTLYQKSDSLSSLSPSYSHKIKLKNIRRKFCKIELKITAEGDNAIKVSKSLSGLIFSKFIYLSEDDFINPYSVLIFAGLIAAIIGLMLYPMITTR